MTKHTLYKETKMRHLNQDLKLKVLSMSLSILALVMLSACGATHEGTDSATKPIPAPQQSASGSGRFCGDLLAWSYGLTFLVASNGDVSQLQYGTFGFNESYSGWGAYIPACHYVVSASAPKLVN